MHCAECCIISLISKMCGKLDARKAGDLGVAAAAIGQARLAIRPFQSLTSMNSKDLV